MDRRHECSLRNQVWRRQHGEDSCCRRRACGAGTRSDLRDRAPSRSGSPSKNQHNSYRFFSCIPCRYGRIWADQQSQPPGRQYHWIYRQSYIRFWWASGCRLLQEIAPDLQRVGIMYNPDTAPYAPPLIASAKASAIRNATVIELHVRNDSDIHTAAALLATSRMVAFW